MTGEQLYNGWVVAAIKLGHVVLTQAPAWGKLQMPEVMMWDRAAAAITAIGGMPLSTQVFIACFGNNWLNQVTPKIRAIADELVANWGMYFGGFGVGGFNFSGHEIATTADSDHQKGDVWVFRAGKSRAVVVDVDGRMVKLRLNRIDTDWISVDELAKDAEKEVK